MKKVLPFLCCIVVMALASCNSNKNMVYFRDIDDNPERLETLYKDYAVRVKPADELLITVWSEVPAATAIYNMPQVAYAEGTDNTLAANTKILSYIVDKDGCINFPIVGKVKVEGLTVDEVSDLLTERISKDVNNPYVRVQLASFRVNVMGEVNAPGAKWVAKERYSVLDAISDAGDINQYGRRDNILLIREDSRALRSYHRLDLGCSDLLTSPYFYLQQNDVVYVEPNDVRQSNAEYNQNNSYKVQVISTAISAVSVIATLIIALVIK